MWLCLKPRCVGSTFDKEHFVYFWTEQEAEEFELCGLDQLLSIHLDCPVGLGTALELFSFVDVQCFFLSISCSMFAFNFDILFALGWQHIIISVEEVPLPSLCSCIRWRAKVRWVDSWWTSTIMSRNAGNPAGHRIMLLLNNTFIRAPRYCFWNTVLLCHHHSTLKS